MPVVVVLPGVLADLVGGSRHLDVALPAPATVAGLLTSIAAEHPGLHRRLCDETGTIRRFVNVYVDGEDVRLGNGSDTALRDGATVQILPSVAGGAGPFG